MMNGNGNLRQALEHMGQVPEIRNAAQTAYDALDRLIAEDRRTRGLPRQMLAERSLCHDWPAQLQHLWRSCRGAREVYDELTLACAHGGMQSERLRQLAQLAYENWQQIEAHAAPVMAAHEGR